MTRSVWSNGLIYISYWNLKNGVVLLEIWWKYTWIN